MGASISSPAAVGPLVDARAAALPAYLKAVLFASTSIVLGILWDFAWHRTIGRDTFFSPPHVAMYVGAIVAGLASAWVIFRDTFAGTPAQRGRGVRVWGLTGPLGAFYCSWGAGAMLVSAPFDDWWHNAYGLDTKILSPPHVLLLVGIIVIQVGAMITAVSLQNRQAGAAADDGVASASPRALRLAYAYASGIVLITAGIFLTAQTSRVLMHSSLFYQAVCGAFPLFLVATAQASKLRWPATTATLFYMGVILANHWVMPLIPAEPKLGPVRQTITHMVAGPFPLLLVAPALVVDWMVRRFSSWSRWRLALVLGPAFFAAFFAAQWPFADFLMTPHARNWVFGAHSVSYATPPTSYQVLHKFYPYDASTGALLVGLAICIPLAIAATRLGLVWGGWMRKVQR